MLQAFIVVFREGFESFLIVGIILAYLRRIGQDHLVPAMYWGIAASLLASAGLGYMLSRGVNEALWEGLFGVATIILVGSLVVHMWKAGAQMKRHMESRLGRISARSSGLAFAGVFLFTLVMITKEGMETVLMLFQIHDSELVTGVVLGVVGAAAISWAWVNFGHLINVKRFFPFMNFAKPASFLTAHIGMKQRSRSRLPAFTGVGFQSLQLVSAPCG
jgi:high-affinity iron transporter